MSSSPLERPIRGLKLPSDRRVLPPTIQGIVFLLVFRAAISLGTSMLLVVFVWTPAAREYGRRMRGVRSGKPRLPYRYAGPQPNRDDLNAGG